MSGPTDFAPISVDKAIENHVRNNGGDADGLRREFAAAIRRKLDGQKCMACQSLAIWALGGCGMCFPCTTGEADASGDYEFESVCF